MPPLSPPPLLNRPEPWKDGWLGTYRKASTKKDARDALVSPLTHSLTLGVRLPGLRHPAVSKAQPRNLEPEIRNGHWAPGLI